MRLETRGCVTLLRPTPTSSRDVSRERRRSGCAFRRTSCPPSSESCCPTLDRIVPRKRSLADMLIISAWPSQMQSDWSLRSLQATLPSEDSGVLAQFQSAVGVQQTHAEGSSQSDISVKVACQRIGWARLGRGRSTWVYDRVNRDGKGVSVRLWSLCRGPSVFIPLGAWQSSGTLRSLIRKWRAREVEAPATWPQE